MNFIVETLASNQVREGVEVDPAEFVDLGIQAAMPRGERQMPAV